MKKKENFFCLLHSYSYKVQEVYLYFEINQLMKNHDQEII
jgi:hypothetical protein